MIRNVFFFLPCNIQFSKMGRYDVSGIGINLREIPDENGEVKLKVLGLLLDGPAYSAGVRQVVMSLRLLTQRVNTFLVW